jgi:uncharacterized protein with GYD domain
MLTRLSPDALARPDAVQDLNHRVEARIEAECPEIRWLGNYALLGPYDYLDLFEAPDQESATKVALLVRSLGHATTEIWAATPWERFLAIAHDVSGPAAEVARPEETEYAHVRMKGGAAR